MSSPAYFAPTCLDDAVRLLGQHADALVVAGGVTVTLVGKWTGAAPRCLVYVGGVPELRGIVEKGSTVSIGALTTHADLARSPIVRGRVAILAEAAAQVGSPQVRNQGTIGGNLVWASPDADLAPPLLALDATLELRGAEGARAVPVRDFLLGPGTTAIRPDELLTAICVEARPHGAAFLKLGRRKTAAVAIASVAVVLRPDASGRRCIEAAIALGASVPMPRRAEAAEAMLRGADLGTPALENLARQAGRAAADHCGTASDVRAPGWYRRAVTAVLVERAIRSAAARVAAGQGG